MIHVKDVQHAPSGPELSDNELIGRVNERKREQHQKHLVETARIAALNANPPLGDDVLLAMVDKAASVSGLRTVGGARRTQSPAGCVFCVEEDHDVETPHDVAAFAITDIERKINSGRGLVDLIDTRMQNVASTLAAARSAASTGK